MLRDTAGKPQVQRARTFECVCVCVCERERERKRERDRERWRERGRKREIDRERDRICVCVRVCLCVHEVKIAFIIAQKEIKWWVCLELSRCRLLFSPK